MKIKYPEFAWAPHPAWNLRFTAATTYWSLDVTYSCTDEYWLAIVNNRAVTSGGGPHGYEFASEAEAKAAAEEEVTTRIDKAVEIAINNLRAYCPEMLA